MRPAPHQAAATITAQSRCLWKHASATRGFNDFQNGFQKDLKNDSPKYFQNHLQSDFQSYFHNDFSNGLQLDFQNDFQLDCRNNFQSAFPNDLFLQNDFQLNFQNDCLNNFQNNFQNDLPMLYTTIFTIFFNYKSSTHKPLSQPTEDAKIIRALSAAVELSSCGHVQRRCCHRVAGYCSRVFRVHLAPAAENIGESWR